MQDPRELTITSAIALMRKGQLTAQRLVESCLERIHDRELAIHAWVDVREKEVLEEAHRLDAEAEKGRWQGTLHGIPIGVKDIVHVKGMWTRAGCDVYPAHVADSDAATVRRLREAGAIILGKTVTTAFAGLDPSITRNPWNPEHTPGGSSSGSGASVADRMCLAALGTQTAGSLLRPSAYNGIVAFKATYSSISIDGVIPVSWTLDHIGPNARCAADAALLWYYMKEEHPLPFSHIPRCDALPERRPPGSPPRLGRFRDFFEKDVAAEVLESIEQAQEKFARAGARIVELKLPQSFTMVVEAHGIIRAAEQLTYHRTLFSEHRDKYPPILKARLEEALDISLHRYIEALHQRRTFQGDMCRTLADVDAAMMPTVHSTAPAGLSTTGSPALCVPWTFCGFPSLTLPSALDRGGLPIGIQLAGLPWEDENLLETGRWCEDLLGFQHAP